MQSYFATQGRNIVSGGWLQCLSWALEKSLQHPVRILKARGGESTARVVAEVDRGNVRLIRGGRVIAISRLTKKLTCQA